MTENQKQTFIELLVDLTRFLKENFKVNSLPKVTLVSDQKNADLFLGKTGEYNKENKEIRIYITGIHPKSLLRSYCHEWTHFFQDVNGRLDNLDTSDPKYAQNNKELRKLEMEAYLSSMYFRDWEDQYKKEHGNI